MKVTIISYLIIIMLGLLLLNLLMYYQQSMMIYFPMKEIQQTPADWRMDYEDVTLTTSDKVQIHGWFIPHKKAKQTLLFFHGNAGNISHRRESIEIFHRLGLNVFIIDYRGYGNSNGMPDEQGLYKDALAAWSYLTKGKDFTGDQILIFGRSLGGAVAANLASRVQAGGVLLESTFSSARDFAGIVFPFLSRLILMRYEFKTAEMIKQVTSPVLVIHSPDDEIMPYQLGEKVFESANQPKQFMRLKGDHNFGFTISQPEYEKGLKDWITKLNLNN